MIQQVYEWVAQQAKGARAPVLEVGSLNVNGSVRDLLPIPYIGLDMREGDGVDVVADFMEWCPPHRFNTIVSTETLEHMKTPWRAIRRMYDMLEPGGLCLITVPWMFEYHGYPDDYWRISHTCLAMLFKDAGFKFIECTPTGSHTIGKARRPWA